MYEFRQHGSSQRSMQTRPSFWSGLGNNAGYSTRHPKCCVSSNQDTGQHAASWGQNSLATSWFVLLWPCAPVDIPLSSRTTLSRKSKGERVKRRCMMLCFLPIHTAGLAWSTKQGSLQTALIYLSLLVNLQAILQSCVGAQADHSSVISTPHQVCSCSFESGVM